MVTEIPDQLKLGGDQGGCVRFPPNQCPDNAGSSFECSAGWLRIIGIESQDHSREEA